LRERLAYTAEARIRRDIVQNDLAGIQHRGSAQDCPIFLSHEEMAALRYPPPDILDRFVRKPLCKERFIAAVV
jgi:hypothetical protein